MRESALRRQLFAGSRRKEAVRRNPGRSSSSLHRLARGRHGGSRWIRCSLFVSLLPPPSSSSSSSSSNLAAADVAATLRLAHSSRLIPPRASRTVLLAHLTNRHRQQSDSEGQGEGQSERAAQAAAALGGGGGPNGCVMRSSLMVKLELASPVDCTRSLLL